MALMTSEIREISRVFMGMFRNEIVDILDSVMHKYEKDSILTVKDVARIMGKTEGAIKKRCSRGKLPGRKDETGEYYFSEKELYDFLLAKKENVE